MLLRQRSSVSYLLHIKGWLDYKMSHALNIVTNKPDDIADTPSSSLNAPKSQGFQRRAQPTPMKILSYKTINFRLPCWHRSPSLFSSMKLYLPPHCWLCSPRALCPRQVLAIVFDFLGSPVAVVWTLRRAERNPTCTENYNHKWWNEYHLYTTISWTVCL